MSTDEELRRAVRAILEEALSSGDRVAASPLSTDPTTIQVHIQTDADLAAFVHKVLDLVVDPAKTHAIREGRLRFVMDHAAPALGPSAGGEVLRLRGEALTEKKLSALPPGTTRIVLERGAVVTPLARERARQIGITLERSTPC